MRTIPPATVLASLLLTSCTTPTTPDRFEASDFFGEWRVTASETPCWPALDIRFAIDGASIERDGRGAMSFSSRWGGPGESPRVRLVNGSISWNFPDFPNFQIAFYQSGELLAQLVSDPPAVSADRLAGTFFNPNRAPCRTGTAAVKVAP